MWRESPGESFSRWDLKAVWSARTLMFVKSLSRPRFILGHCKA